MDLLEEHRFKGNVCVRRRLNIQHQNDEHYRQQNRLYKLKTYKHQEHLFNRQIQRLRKDVERIRPYTHDDDINNIQVPIIPNGFNRIQNHSRLLHFSPQTQNRLLCRAPSYKNLPHKPLPPITPSTNKPTEPISYEIEQCRNRVSYYQSRLPMDYSCRRPIDLFPFPSSPKPFLEKSQRTNFLPYIEQFRNNENLKQFEYEKRQENLLKEIDQLKYTIDDPHSTLSVLAALSRALIYMGR